MKSILGSFRELLRYPSAVVGGTVILGLIILAIYAVVTIPYDEAVRLWRGGEEEWYQNPRNALPEWTNLLSNLKKPLSLALTTADDSVTTEVTKTSDGYDDITHTYTFDYSYDYFPQEVSFFFKSEYVEKQPFVSIKWITPDEREIRIVELGVKHAESYRFKQDDRLTRRLGGETADIALFMDPDSDPDNPVVLKGTYQVVARVVNFEEGSKTEPELVLHGTVHGIAGTDHRRRDLTIGLLWGAPVALAFGLGGALGTSVLTIIIAGIGTWFGGVVDGIIQRITEVNLVLPVLSILIMVGTFYSKSLWVMLGVTILLFIFSASIKSYRAMFLQVRESPYIEAAQAYGASDARIIFMYLIPRLIPLVIPALVLSVPTFVFLEATLAVLGLGDPTLATWGRIIYDGVANAAIYNEYFYWVLEPAILLTLTGLGFALVGFSLDRVFNPRLRGM